MQNPSTAQPMPKDLARKRILAWLRALILVLLLSPVVWIFIRTGRQIEIERNLLLAIRRNDAPTVEFLLSAGADANTQVSLEDTRFMPTQIISRLRGYPVPTSDSALLVHLQYVGRTRHRAAFTGWKSLPENTTIDRALLDHHANPNALGEGSNDTALMRATDQGKDKTVQLLLERGAKVNLKDFQAMDALYYAVVNGSADCVRLLLDAGADINSQDSFRRTPLINVVLLKDVPLVKLLIARGADVNIKDNNSCSALTYAIRRHDLPMIALLKAAGAK